MPLHLHQNTHANELVRSRAPLLTCSFKYLSMGAHEPFYCPFKQPTEKSPGPAEEVQFNHQKAADLHPVYAAVIGENRPLDRYRNTRSLMGHHDDKRKNCL
jgi:hypothetical protein